MVLIILINISYILIKYWKKSNGKIVVSLLSVISFLTFHLDVCCLFFALNSVKKNYTDLLPFPRLFIPLTARAVSGNIIFSGAQLRSAWTGSSFGEIHTEYTCTTEIQHGISDSPVSQ